MGKPHGTFISLVFFPIDDLLLDSLKAAQPSTLHLQSLTSITVNVSKKSHQLHQRLSFLLQFQSLLLRHHWPPLLPLLRMLLVESLLPTFLPLECSRTFPFRILQVCLVNSLRQQQHLFRLLLHHRRVTLSRVLIFHLIFSVHITSFRKTTLQS